MLSLLYLRVKTQQYFESLRYMFLDETPLLKIWLNHGINLNHLSRNWAQIYILKLLGILRFSLKL